MPIAPVSLLVESAKLPRSFSSVAFSLVVVVNPAAIGNTKTSASINASFLFILKPPYYANQELKPKKRAQAILAKIKAVNPAEERTFAAFWMLVFSIIQLLKDSMTCFTLETAVEKTESQ